MSAKWLLDDEKIALKDIHVHVHSSLNSEVVVQPLVTKNIWKASKSWFEAFVDDPLMDYVGCEQPREERRGRLSISSLFGLWQYTKVALTVNDGDAVAVVTPPSRNPVHRGLEAILEKLLNKLSRKASGEKKKRQSEFGIKLETATKEAIGDSGKSMWYVDLVCTNPESQGHGYGSALLHEITTRLDKKKKAAWLVSSNINNEPFYNFHGFYSAADFYLGDDNPQWTRKPVKVQVMIRYPQSV